MAKFQVFGVEVEIDFTSKNLQEELQMGNRYLEINDQLAGIADEDMTDEQLAMSEEQTSIFCELHYERGVQFDFH